MDGYPALLPRRPLLNGREPLVLPPGISDMGGKEHSGWKPRISTRSPATSPGFSLISSTSLEPGKGGGLVLLCRGAETTVFCGVWPAIINNCLQVFCFSAHFLVPWLETRGFNFFLSIIDFFFKFLVITDFLSVLPRTYSEKLSPCHGVFCCPFPMLSLLQVTPWVSSWLI